MLKESEKQKSFDRNFDIAFKIGFTLMLLGALCGILSILVRAHFGVAFAIVASGGLTCLCAFWADIMFSPKWKR